MSESARLDRLSGHRTLAALFVAASLVAAAPRGAWSSDKAPASRPASVVVVPFVLDGLIEDGMTKEFVKKLSSDKAGWHMVDGAAVAGKLPKGKRFGSGTEVTVLRKAAKAAGVKALIIGRASRYEFLDAPSIRLKVSLVRAGDGEELHSELIKASSWTSKGAKSEAAEDAAKKLIKDFRGR